MRARALCVLTAASALALATAAPAQGPEPFDLFVLKVDSPLLEKEGPYIRKSFGGTLRARVWVRNLGPGDAPATDAAFRWAKSGSNVKVVGLGAVDAGDQRKSKIVNVPFPAKNGKYRLWACANTPRADEPESRRGNNCSRFGRTVLVRRDFDKPNPILLSIDPAAHDFGSVPPGVTSATQNFTVRNMGTGQTGAGQVVMSGADPSAFQVQSNGCTAGLRPAGACRVSATFATVTPGTYTADLVVQFGGGSSVRAKLTGTSG
jgi:HYDIN/CFA65/VesB-like, Ig-like domain